MGAMMIRTSIRAATICPNDAFDSLVWRSTPR